MAMIKLIDINKKYGDKTVYNNFNLEIEDNKTLVILGESGCGKTTLLNVLAGLTDFEGNIENLPKDISFVFQQDRLIPNMTVEQNLKFISPNADVDYALKQAGIGDAGKLYPKSLSAGMSRRVAFLRAFLYPSSLLLMDEPFINLDLSIKYKLMDLLRKSLLDSPKTCVIVTHDVKEAVELGDRIIVLSSGKIIKNFNSVTESTEDELFDIMKNIKN